MTGRQAAARRGVAAPLLVAAAGLLLAGCGGNAASTDRVDAGVVRPVRPQGDLPERPPPTAAPSPPADAVAATRAAPVYQTVFRFAAPSVGIDLPVITVGVVHGAMDAPEGPLPSPFWREAFWLDQGAVPGTPGTSTIAGHLDDTAGQPAAFWNIRQLKVGDVVSLTRLADGVTVRYHISEVDVLTDSVAASPPYLHRLYGSAGGGVDDGTARISLITCTGHWRGSAAGYDHRFIAFGEMVA